MRARQPDKAERLERNGVRIHYEVFGNGQTTVLLLPAWSIVNSRLWKAQVPYLARHFRVLTFDGRGSGLSDRPKGPAAYVTAEFVADAVAVLDATATERVVAVGLSLGGHWAAMLARHHPERVTSAMLIAPAAPLPPLAAGRSPEDFTRVVDAPEGWAKFNRYYWQRDLPDFAQFFFGQCFPEPYSTKQIEDCVGWAGEISAETLIDTVLSRGIPQDDGESAYRSIRRPIVVVTGDQDRIAAPERSRLVASLTGAPLVTIAGSGHIPIARIPVPMNLLIRDFAERSNGHVAPSTKPRGAAPRGRRALYLSSPIGLGHARRDLAIARELRVLQPDLEIDWLTQHPVTALLEKAGERVHPVSRLLVNESKHIEDEAHEHDLHVFQALRRMDEILVANFMVFNEAVEEGDYDLVIADEAWDVDHFLHEHPDLKRCTLAWLTDFVGLMPIPEGGDREEFLTTDYNAEMLEHIDRSPRLRDAAIFVGNPDDIVPGTFGRGLPEIRRWTEQHFDFCGYVTGRAPVNRDEVREQLGYRNGEKVCIATVGGSGVGIHLLRRIVDAVPAIQRRVPEMRFIVVTGPRIDPRALPVPRGVEVHGYVPDLDRCLAACDVALVQGGLTTCMELTAARVPFLYFPLKNHFEQNVHVRHRLERYSAGRRLDYATVTPDEIADSLVAELARPIAYRPVESDGARRAAGLLSRVL